MKKVCVVTATRAEYGLLYPILKLIEKDTELELQLIVSGTHLSKKYGYTKNEIIQDGFPIAAEIDILDDVEDECAVSKAMGSVLIQFSQFIAQNRPDIAIILGDRYEMMAFATVFVNAKIPIAHLNGGETTEGALDEAYRHCITKMSMYHFVNCEVHRKRVIQLGENPSRVFNVGDTCVDNILNQKYMAKEKLKIKLNLEKFPENLAIVTYHPVTLEENSIEQFQKLLDVLEKHGEYFYLFTKANADYQGDKLNQLLEERTKNWDNAKLVDSMGREYYISALKYASIMIGNSSSGLYEAPVFKIPTINIGNRQKGRVHGNTVIDCKADREEISKAILTAQSERFQNQCKASKNIFGEGHASEQIINSIKKELKEKINLEKKFYDINFVEEREKV
ncbi:UDP-N-acetylglucosamine 2-epimerase [Roseburia sp.]|uniref:UDP-N-acetylglucosamine 2-epimerase n=1 Tax=Roseburia sp. TaxID=2049040 RepID=UPI0035229AEA